MHRFPLAIALGVLLVACGSSSSSTPAADASSTGADSGPVGIDEGFGESGYFHELLEPGNAVFPNRSLAMFVDDDGAIGVVVARIADDSQVSLLGVSPTGQSLGQKLVTDASLRLHPHAVHDSDGALIGAVSKPVNQASDGPGDILRFVDAQSFDADWGQFEGGVLPPTTSLVRGPQSSLTVVGLEHREGDGIIEARAARVSREGAVDSGFGPGGRRPLDTDALEISAVASDSMGRLVVLSTNVVSPPRVERLLATGERDLSFGEGGVVELADIRPTRSATLTVDASDRVIVAANSLNADNQRLVYLRRLETTGEVDATFAFVDDSRELFVRQVLADADGSLYVLSEVIVESLNINDAIMIPAILHVEDNGQLAADFGEAGLLELDQAPVIGYRSMTAELGPDRSLSVLVGHYDGTFQGQTPKAPEGLGFFLVRLQR